MPRIVFLMGTKYSKMSDASASEKVNKVFSKFMNHCSSSLQDMLGKYFGKGQRDNKTMVLLKNREPSSMASVKEFLDLKYSWVQRWCHNKAAVQLPLLADVSGLPTKVINYVSRTSKTEIKVRGYYELL
ncbi:hypothetical protein NE237_024394 [Protea cynaroides]|uniref:Uncharacterized protein n=1 Tax=Protea cynaroides TaxID=273540 RepID=A0A9Q0HET4_9MAGN|nr:hypothetical protein NE237_024394 [Protea cynaroides]